MSIYTFDNAGLQAKLANMYNQSDQQLATEADSAASDFKSWITDNFILDSYQLTYLNNVPMYSLKIWGHIYAAAFLTRTPITMSAVVPNPEPRRTKEIRKSFPSFELKYDDLGKVTASDMSIQISYSLL